MKKIVTILLLCSDCRKDAHAEISCWRLCFLPFFFLPFFNFNPACEFVSLPYPRKTIAMTEAALPILASVGSIFLCPDTGVNVGLQDF